MNASTIEILKLITSILTPISVVVIGLFINKRLKVFEHKQWKNQKLIEKRLEIYSELFPLFNDLFCYYTFVGNWKDLSPEDIIKHKRIIDKKIHLSIPLFSDEFINSCFEFMNSCFDTYTGWGKDPQLRTTIRRHKQFFSGDWNQHWDTLFCNTDMSADEDDIENKYSNMMSAFSKEIGLQ